MQVLDLATNKKNSISQENVDLTFKHKKPYSFGLFWSETPQSKTFTSEPYVSPEGKVELGKYTIGTQKAWFQESIYKTNSFDNMFEFAEYITKEMTCNHYMTSGTLNHADDYDKVVVVAGRDLEEKSRSMTFEEENGKVIARKKEFITVDSKPSIICFDIDSFKGKLLDLEKEIIPAIMDSIEGLDEAPIVIVPSTGSNIYAKSNPDLEWVDKEGVTLPKDDLGNSKIRGNHGYHIFVGVTATSYLEKVVGLINKRLWLNGYGFIQVSEDGKMNERCLIDTSVLKPVQPIYTHANLDSRLFQKIDNYILVNPNNKPFSLSGIEKLTHDEEVRYKSLVEEEKALLQTEAEAKRKKWAYGQAASSESAKRAGKKGSAAWKLIVNNLSEEYIKTSKDRVLSGKQEVRITPITSASGSLITKDTMTDEHGGIYIIRTIEQILEKPDLYHGARTACIENLYYAPGGKSTNYIDYTRGRIYIKHEPFPKIHDFAHGGTDYKLLRDKVAVDLIPDGMDEVIDQCLSILKKRNCIYKQGNLPYELTLDEYGKLVLTLINKHHFKYTCAKNFSFFSFENGNREMIWPKETFVVPILEQFCIRNENETKGVSTIPYMDISGHVRIKKGYDPSTGFIYDDGGSKIDGQRNFVGLENKVITKKEMIKALKVIEGPIKLFSFSDDISSANMLGGMLTVVLKQWFNNDKTEMYPGFTTDAPGNGIGKTKLLQILGVLLKGHLPPVSTLEGNQEEIKKEIGAKFASGEDFFLFDNVDKKLDSPTMASMMTTKNVVFRILGLSKENSFKNGSFVTASGKNMKMTAELVRRFMNIRIQPVEVDYLTHDFGFDPVEYTLKHRFDILKSLMVLYMGYIQAIEAIEKKQSKNLIVRIGWEEDIERIKTHKKNMKGKKLGSFEIWSNKVGGCVKFVGDLLKDKEDKTAIQYGFPGGNISTAFQEEVEKDMGKFFLFMGAFCEYYKDELKEKGSKVRFKWTDLEKMIDNGAEEEENKETVLYTWSKNSRVKSGRAFSGLTKKFAGLVGEFNGKNVRFTDNGNRRKIYYLTVE